MRHIIPLTRISEGFNIVRKAMEFPPWYELGKRTISDRQLVEIQSFAMSLKQTTQEQQGRQHE